jgi:hypothetical protein
MQMQKLMVIAMCGMLSLAVWGCKHHDEKSTGSTSSAPAAKTADACPHCAGVQNVTAAGNCSSCGAKAKS